MLLSRYLCRIFARLHSPERDTRGRDRGGEKKKKEEWAKEVARDIF